MSPTDKPQPRQSLSRVLFSWIAVLSVLLWMANVRSGTAWRMWPMLLGQETNDLVGSLLTNVGPVCVLVLALIYVAQPSYLAARWCYVILFLNSGLGLFVHYFYSYFIELHPNVSKDATLDGLQVLLPVTPRDAYWIALGLTIAVIFSVDYGKPEWMLAAERARAMPDAPAQTAAES